VLISNPTWAVHNQIFEMEGMVVKEYRYWNASTRGLDFAGFIADLEAAASGSVVLLHACAHNPTGVDPTPEQWEQVAEVMKKKGHFTLFDSAYQGFASGSQDKDASAIRLFVSRGLEMAVCVSFAKNFGLYCERIGYAAFVTSSAEIAGRVQSNFSPIVRPMYSNPPAHGARIVKMVLSTPALKAEWESELQVMSGRISSMRKLLRESLERRGTPGTWNHITDQIGMFSFTGLTREQSLAMTSQFHVYMLPNGRISMAGVNTRNVEYLAAAINAVITGKTTASL
jgi:aspartate aminotransferase